VDVDVVASIGVFMGGIGSSTWAGMSVLFELEFEEFPSGNTLVLLEEASVVFEIGGTV